MPRYDWTTTQYPPCVILDRATGKPAKEVGRIFLLETDERGVGELHYYVRMPDGSWRQDKKGKLVQRRRRGSFLVIWEGEPPSMPS